jgi:hypothetical protein
MNSCTTRFTLLNHTTPGTVTLAATYTLPAAGYGAEFTPDGDYIAVAHGSSPFFTLLNHTTPGTVSLAATYVLSGVKPEALPLAPMEVTLH